MDDPLSRKGDKIFQSTLSVRRATHESLPEFVVSPNFNPRSP